MGWRKSSALRDVWARAAVLRIHFAALGLPDQSLDARETSWFDPGLVEKWISFRVHGLAFQAIEPPKLLDCKRLRRFLNLVAQILTSWNRLAHWFGLLEELRKAE
jgi:hypothetical protein